MELKIDTNPQNAPEYIKEYVVKPTIDGPSVKLNDGNFCGHGETTFKVYDVKINNELAFNIQLPLTDSDISFHPNVRLYLKNSTTPYIIYNSAEHPASCHNIENKPMFEEMYKCVNCNHQAFKVSVGFEVPEDSSENNDTSWFALSAKCCNCGQIEILYEDETA